MPELFKIYFISITLGDVIDIAVVSILFYWALRLMRDSRARPMLMGIAIIFLGAVVAFTLDLKTVAWIVRRLSVLWALVFVILFQTEIKELLTRLGNLPIFKPFFPKATSETIDNIVEGVRLIMSNRYGALIAVRRKTSLESVISSGKRIGAKVTPELLATIFSPATPLHDGGVVISGDNIVAAACEFPLTQDEHFRKNYGMRHRAAIGMAEHSDALVIIVSEETGAASLAIHHTLKHNLPLDELYRNLLILMGENVRQKKKATIRNEF